MNGIILKVFMFSKEDLECFVDQPEEFFNRMLQIVELDTIEYAKAHDKDVDGGAEVDDYSNLRTLAATLLEAVCKHIDGSLPEILTFSLQVLQSGK